MPSTPPRGPSEASAHSQAPEKTIKQWRHDLQGPMGSLATMIKEMVMPSHPGNPAVAMLQRDFQGIYQVLCALNEDNLPQVLREYQTLKERIQLVVRTIGRTIPADYDDTAHGNTPVGLLAQAIHLAHMAITEMDEFVAAAEGGLEKKRPIPAAEIAEMIHQTCVVKGALSGREPRESVQIEPDITTVTAYAVRLHTMLQNLIGNALKAHHERGLASEPVIAVTIQRAGHPGDGFVCWVQPEAPIANGIEIRVEDQSGGLPAEVMQAPGRGFTTQKAAEGHGIGVSAVIADVQKHGGALWVKSEEGKGAAFAIILPQ